MPAGIGGAALVAAAIIAVGSLSSGDRKQSGTYVASQALPSGHPTVSQSADTTPAATANSSVQRSIEELARRSHDEPRDVNLLLKLGDACFLAQRYNLAEEAFRSVLRLKPGHPSATVRLAMVWHTNGDTARALRAVRRAARDHPKNQEAHYSMAILYFSIERVDDARDQWAQAASIDPTTTIGRRSRNFVELIDGEQSSSQGQGE